MNIEMYVERNDALHFAERTRVNLEFIEESKAEGCDVHVVTQLANSLLGLVVFVWEKEFVDHMQDLELEKLVHEGWPRIEVTKDEDKIKTRTLYDFVRRLRNGVAHCRFLRKRSVFLSESDH
jgi:HEPN family protein